MALLARCLQEDNSYTTDDCYLMNMEHYVKLYDDLEVEGAEVKTPIFPYTPCSGVCGRYAVSTPGAVS